MIDTDNRRSPVGDHQNCFSLNEAGESRLDLGLGFGVCEGGGLVEHKDWRVDKQCARNRNALCLPARGMGVFSYDGVEASWKGTHVVVNAGSGSSCPDCLVLGICPAQRNIFTHGYVKKLRILENKRHVPVEDVGSNGSHINASDTHTALVWISKAGNQGCEGGLSRTGWADERGHCPFGNCQTDLV